MNWCRIAAWYAAVGMVFAFICLNLLATPDSDNKRLRLDEYDLLAAGLTLLLWPIAVPALVLAFLSGVIHNVCIKHDWHPFEWLFLWPARLVYMAVRPSNKGDADE